LPVFAASPYYSYYHSVKGQELIHQQVMGGIVKCMYSVQCGVATTYYLFKLFFVHKLQDKIIVSLINRKIFFSVE